MTISRATIARNASALFMAQLLTWIFSLALTFGMSRLLGPQGLGTYAFAGATWAIAGVLIGWGMDVFLTKAIARQPGRVTDLLGTTLVLRLGIFLLLLLVIMAYNYVQGFSRELIRISLIFGIATLFVQCAGAYNAALQGMELMHYNSIAMVVAKVALVVLGMAALFAGFGIYGFVWALLCTNLIYLLISRHFCIRQQDDRTRHKTPTVSLAMLRDSTPYLASSLIIVVYLQIGTMLLGTLLNTTAVGWYGAAINLYSALLFVPTILTSAVFPALARSHTSSNADRLVLIRKSFDLMLLFGVPLGLGLMVISRPVVLLLYGEAFAPSAPVLTIMGLVLIFMYQNMLTSQFLVSMDRQNIWTIVLAVITVFTIGLELFLIPWAARVLGNGAIGAAIGFLVAEVVMVVIGLMLLPRGTLTWANASTAARIVLAGLVMVGVCWLFRDAFIGITIAIGAIVFLSLIFLMQVVPADDRALLITSMQRTLLGLRHRFKPASGD